MSAVNSKLDANLEDLAKKSKKVTKFIEGAQQKRQNIKQSADVVSWLTRYLVSYIQGTK